MRPTFTERRRKIDVLGWPTDVIAIDPKPNNANGARPSPVHTILFWIPGNPGQHDWYNSDFLEVLSGLGEGYALRSVSHAGHGLFGKGNGDYSNDNSITDVKEYCTRRGKANSAESVSPLVPWTVDGQVLHKIAYIDKLMVSIENESKMHSKSNRPTLEFTKDLKFIMIGHSFGCHVIQRMCILRPDILERVSGNLFLMPYIRTKPSTPLDQRKLELGGSQSEMLISVGTKLSQTIRRAVPESVFFNLIRHGLGATSEGAGEGRDDDKHNKTIVGVTARLLGHPFYPQNFFELGTEEIRDIPNEIDMAALRLLSSNRSSMPQNPQGGGTRPERPKSQGCRPISILYAGDNDQWCPYFHGEEIKALQSANLLPRSIRTTKMHGLRHDYVCQNRSVRTRVNDWMISNIVEMQSAGLPSKDAVDHVQRRRENSVDHPRTTRTVPKLPSKL